MSDDQNFMLFLDMDSKMLSQFLFENSNIKFEKSKKLVWTGLVARRFQ
jgi:hypothetical protein